MEEDELVIAQTKKWLTDVVIGCNFCPFALKVHKKGSIHYQVEPGLTLALCLESFARECIRLDSDKSIETILIILPQAFKSFNDYLELVSLAESLLVKEGYVGTYQVASFHPLYLFAGAPKDDAANYSNRSIYPMLHLLREASIEKALKKFPDPDQIPGRNIHFAREKGLVYMKMLRESCM